MNSRKDVLIERSFNRNLGTLSYLAHGRNVTELDGGKGSRQKLSLGKAFELILKLVYLTGVVAQIVP